MIFSKPITKLKTWAGKSEFCYEGSIKQGTKIYFGKCNSVNISAEKYEDMLNYFRGSVVNIGTSRTEPPSYSVGKWLQENVTKTATASYIGSILIHEDYAEKLDETPKIKFKDSYP